MPRRQIEDLQVSAPGLFEPIARPINTFYPIRTRAPAPKQAVNLKPLAQGLRKLSFSLAQSQKKKNEEDEQAGAAFATEDFKVFDELAAQVADADDPREALGRLIRQKVEAGEMDEADSPRFIVGAIRAAARRRVGQYQRRVQERLDEVAQLTDANGNNVDPPSVDDILADEWAKLVDQDFILQDFIGSTEASGSKLRVDEAMRSEALKRVKEARETQFRTDVTNEISSRLDRLSTLDLDGEQALQQKDSIQQYVEEEVFGSDFRKPAEVVWQSARISIQRARNADAGEGLRVLEIAEDLEIAGVRIGDDPRFAEELESVRASLMNQERQDQQDELKSRQIAIRQVQQNARDEAITLFAGAVNDPGASPYDALATIEERINNNDTLSDQDKAYSVLAVREMAEQMTAAERTDQEFISNFEDRLYLDGDVEGARILFENALTDPLVEILPRDAERLRIELGQAADLAPLIEQNPAYVSGINEIRQAGNTLTGFAPEAQAQFDRAMIEAEQRFNKDLRAFAREHQNDADGGTSAVREFIEQRTAEISRNVVQRADQQRQGRRELLNEVTRLNDEAQSARSAIQAAIESGQVTESEGRELLLKNREATNRERYLQDPQFAAAASNVRDLLQAQVGADDRFFTSSFDALGRPTSFPTPEGVRLQAEVDRQFRREAQKWFNDPTNLRGADGPEEIRERFRDALPELELAVSERIDRTADLIARGTIRSASGRGGEIIQAQDAQQEAELQQEIQRNEAMVGELVDRAQAVGDQMRAQVDQQDLIRLGSARSNDALASRGGLTADAPSMPRHPAVRSRFYEVYAQASNGQLSPSRLQREAVYEAEQALNDPKLDREEAFAAAANAMALGGIDPDQLLAGAIVVEPTTEEQLELVNRISAFIALRDNGLTSYRGELTQDRINRLVEFSNRRTEIPIQDVELPPYETRLFRTVEDLDEFQSERPQDLINIMNRLGVPQNDAARDEWLLLQLGLIERFER